VTVGTTERVSASPAAAVNPRHHASICCDASSFALQGYADIGAGP